MPTLQYVEVRLTQSELTLSSMVGIMRQITNIRDERQARYGAEQDHADWQKNILGACGEQAVAKHLDLFWSGWLNQLGKPDVGPFDVRTAPFDEAHLIVHAEDPGNRPFIFVTGQNATYRIWGWILGSAAKNAQWWQDKQESGRPAYFVPRSALDPDLTNLFLTEAWAQYSWDRTAKNADLTLTIAL